MEKAFKSIIYIVLGAVLFVASSFYFAEGFYHKMVAEDGVFEYITAIVLLLISILFLLRFINKYRNRNNYWIVFNLLVIMGAFFGFGEEISWGQRIFNFESGDFFMQQNLQNETNLHNLEINGVKINKLIFSQGLTVVFGLYFIGSLVLYKYWSGFKKLIDLYGVPIPSLTHTLIIVIYTVPVFVVPDLRIWELWEATFVVLLLLVFIEPVNTSEKLFPLRN